MITFREAFDRITRAYYKNELEPERACGCFIGNLLCQNSDWFMGVIGLRRKLSGLQYDDVEINEGRAAVGCHSKNTYTLEQVNEMEMLFISTWRYNGGDKEEALFKAMEAALLKLREIHESKGEVIEPIEFKQRELV